MASLKQAARDGVPGSSGRREPCALLWMGLQSAAERGALLKRLMSALGRKQTLATFFAASHDRRSSSVHARQQCYDLACSRRRAGVPSINSGVYPHPPNRFASGLRVYYEWQRSLL